MANNPTIIYHKKFTESLSKFSLDIQEKIFMAISKFVNNPNHPGLNVKPWVSGGKTSGAMEFRVSKYYRCLYRDLGCRNYLFFYVCGHNETNNEKKIASKLVTDQEYGNLELIPDDEIINSLIEEIEKSLTQEPVKQANLFDKFSESELRQLRIPKELFKLIRIIRTREQLLSMKDILPENVYNALDLINEGESVSDIVKTLYGEAEPGEKEKARNDKGKTDPVTASSFISFTPRDEYEENLTAPLENWRIFLHPEQRRLAQRVFDGPARVTGGAGTGKTVVAMHRAKWLAEQITDGRKVLFTTFTKNLAEDISANLDRLIKDPAVRNRIEVTHLDIWTQNYLTAHSDDHVEYDRLGKVWSNAYLKNCCESLSLDFYKEEWERVVLRYETFDQKSYRTVSRAGRPPISGGTGMRDAVWDVFQSFMDQCAKKHFLDIGRAMIRCRKMILAEEKPLYSSIVVDEGQDLSIPAYKLLRAMAGPEHPNDLFIVGDSRQRIYQHHQSFSECGINIKGRTARLRLNYRTTEEIRAAAVRLLGGLDFDDMDGGSDGSAGYRSLLTGPEPVFRSFDSLKQEADFLREQIEMIIDREEEDLKNICLAVRTNQQIRQYMKLLLDRGIEGVDISKMKDADEDNRLRIGTMHRIKGIEFNHVLIAGVDEDDLPPKGKIKTEMTEAQLAELEKSERCLIYVAMTRAKKTVTVTAPGPMSRLITEPPVTPPDIGTVTGTPTVDVEFIDNRKKGGALWIIGGEELEPVMKRCEEIGARFRFKKGGSRATKWRDAWWTKDYSDLSPVFGKALSV